MLKRIIRNILKKLDINLIKSDSLAKMQENINASDEIKLLIALPNQYASELLKAFPQSMSQIRQDLFVLAELGFKRNGYFVEFGATNGYNLSNTHLLEKEFGWKGILAEPARCWHNELRSNRSANIETDCVWRETGSVLNFNEVDEAELSTINSFNPDDSHITLRKQGKTYDVKTISLVDMLIKFNAPKEIDFLSIDTEGSEYEIMSNFDFDKYSFRVITCEHNYTPMREKIFALLTKNGYSRKFEEFSKFDDWYVKS